MENIIHIIEYPKRGPLWKLVDGLTLFPNHLVLETKEKYVDLEEYSENTTFIFHTTGKNFPMIRSLESFLIKGKKCLVFIHTLPDYIVEKGYPDFMGYLSDIQKRSKCIVMVPSNEARKMFDYYDIDCITVNLGIPSIDVIKYNTDLKKYYGKVITVSTKDTEKYRYAKGIDRFIELVKHCGLESDSIILGNDSGCVDGILNVRLSHDDFVTVLANAKAYVQLSRSESYNISAIEAKQLHIPVLVSDVGGHKDSVKDAYCRVRSFDEAVEKLMEIISQGNLAHEHIKYNYETSIENESISEFRYRIENVIRRLG